MRFHAKRLLIGIWSTAALGFLLIILFFRDGGDMGTFSMSKAKEVQGPLNPVNHVRRDSEGDAPDANIFQEVLERLQAVTDRISRIPLRGGRIELPSLLTAGPGTFRPGFHPAIHAGEHEQTHDHVGGHLPPRNFSKAEVDALVAKYGHLLEVSEEMRIYSHVDHNMDHVWPTKGEQHDRIVAQINHEPKIGPAGRRRELTILAYNGLPSDAKPGRSKLVNDQCKVQDCYLTADSSKVKTADVILFQNSMTNPYPGPKHKDQMWVLFFLESPRHTMGLSDFNGLVNLTATYKKDSHIVTPYEKFVPHKHIDKLPENPLKNYAADKPKKVAWFVSNCGTTNGRLAYAQELQKYIHLDIYGACGTMHCFRTKAEQCFKMLSDEYKFYLSFENSNCQDYITEKLYWNALKNDIVPIVLGARKEEYAAVAPPHSYIHVEDFDSPKDLADYLHYLDQNDEVYNRYFLWKETGEFINTYFWCRLCAMAHEALNSPQWVDDLETWWHGEEQCKAISPTEKWASWIK